MITSEQISGSGGVRFARTLSRWFPVPRLLSPLSAGVDVSDSFVRWIVISQGDGGHRVLGYGSEQLPDGAVTDGVIQDVHALAATLHRIKADLGGVQYAHAALPEEAAYVFSMNIPEMTKHDEIMNMIEFELDGRVPIQPSAAVFDFDVIAERENGGAEIGVVVVPRTLAENYANAFEDAGIGLLSLEVQAHSIARAVLGGGADEPVTLSVNFGHTRTGFAVFKRGVPIFTSTVGIGQNAMLHALMEQLALSPEDAELFKEEQGLVPDAGAKQAGIESFVGTASALADEIAKHYRYWDTRRGDKGERVTPVERVLLVGSGANLKGLADYVAGRIQAPVERPNVWRNVCSFGDYIPPLDRRASLQYAAAIGLALRGA